MNYPVLSNLKDAAALREMTMGMAVAHAAFHRDVRHFAYPFGDRRVLAPAACRDGGGGRICQRGIGDARRHRDRPAEPICIALPRIAWDGRQRSLRAMRVILSGAMLSRSAVPALGRGELGSNAGAEALPNAQSDAAFED